MNQFNVSDLITAARCEPVIEPIVIGMESQRPFFQSNTFARWKVNRLTRDEATIGIRFVPLATFAGKPRKIRSGNVMAEPLLATVLTNPENAPAMIIRSI